MNLYPHCIVLTTLFSSLLSPTSFAQQQTSSEEIEEIKVIGQMSEYSAIKTDTPILETARSISVETSEDLIQFGALELADAYTYSAGVAGETFGFATRGDWVRVRGLDVPQYQDSLQSLFGNYNNTRPEVYMLEQVEILKGPASVLYGQGSPGGIVNVVSKRARPDSGNEVTFSFGSFDYRQFNFDLGGQLDSQGNWYYRVVGLKRDSETQVKFVEDNALAIAPSITYQPSDDTEISLLLHYQDSDAAPGAQFLPIFGTLRPAPNGQFIASDFFAGEPGFNKYDGETKSATLLATHQINETWSAQVTARKTEGERDYQQAWVTFFPPDRYIRNPDGSLFGNGRVPRSFYEAIADSEQTAFDVRLRANFETGNFDHELMVGTQIQDVTTNQTTKYAYGLGLPGTPNDFLGDAFWINVFNPTYGNVPPASIIDLFAAPTATTKIKDRGFYINDQITYGNLHWNIGLRKDDVENNNGSTIQKDDATSFSTGLLYAFENGISPYISYAESFEPVVGVDAVTNQPFKPQDGEQIEAGIKYVFGNNNGYLTFAYFDIERSNVLTSTPVGSTQSDGVDQVDGFELETKFEINQFEIEFNASDLKTKNSRGFRFSSVPDKNASVWVGYKPNEMGFNSGLGIRYSGASFGGADTIETPAYTLVDAMLGYQMENWAFRVNARNLADKEYQSTCLSRGDCFQGERRTIIGSINYKF